MSEEDPVITWTRPMLERFKKALAKANGKNFTFDGHEFVSGYAKYLIDYLEEKLSRIAVDDDTVLGHTDYDYDYEGPAEADADGGEKN